MYNKVKRHTLKHSHAKTFCPIKCAIPELKELLNRSNMKLTIQTLSTLSNKCRMLSSKAEFNGQKVKFKCS